MNGPKSLLLASLLFLLLACSHSTIESAPPTNSVKQAPTAPAKYPRIEKGKLVNPIYCLSDTSQSYAAYLPSDYDSSKHYPLLIAFDAHAAGRIPVEAYKELGEKYKYIILASNNSKNGLDAETINYIASTFINDAKARFAVDQKRIYLTGFSGGSRVAANIAMQGGVCGLAGCSAGFQPNAAVPFNFIGFAGNEDFNSAEMIELNRTLDFTNTNHQLILFNGKHEWPAAKVFENAFLWFEFNAMKDKLIPMNEALINEFKNKETTKIKELQANGKVYEAYTEADKSGNFIFGLTDCSEILNLRTSLEKTTALKTIFKEKAQIEKREKELQTYYRKAMQENDLAWWNSEVNNLNAQLKSKQNSPEENLLFKRTLSFLSLLTYMTANAALNQNQFQAAGAYLQLYEKVDPENSEVYYLQALLAAKKQQPDDIAPLLQKAINAGFTDVDRIEKEPYFNLIKESAAYKTLLNKMRRF